jgi:signal peptidase I
MARAADKKSRSRTARRGSSSRSRGGTSKTDAASKEGDREERVHPERWTSAWLVDWAKTGIFAFIIFLVLRNFVLASFVIDSGSMENTLLVGDFLLVNKVILGSPIPGTALRIPGYGDPNRNDIIVFRADHAPGLDIVKRTVGIPGDTIGMIDGVLQVNGVAQEEPWLLHDERIPDGPDPQMTWQLSALAPGVDRASYRPTRDNWGPLVIPEERYFMLGDNREHSLDSRYWGLVERKKMKGKPFFTYYSYDRDAIKPLPFLTALRFGRIGPSPH